MDITKQQLIDLYKKIEERYKAIHGDEITTIEMDEDGNFIAKYEYYSCGDWETASMEITLDDLDLDISDVIADRKRKEEEKKILQKQRHEEMLKRENDEATKKRKLQYEKLKKEFEQS